MAQSQPNWVGHTFGGRYKVDEWIAQGGMSTVYKATDPNLRRAVAIKLIHPHLSGDPEFVRRFEKEAAAVAQLRHPNIIQVYDFDHESNVYYMVLEFVPGETLQAVLKTLNDTNRRLALVETVRIMTTVCDAVAYAHQHGMIHRDLKPANVMLNRQGQPILMDFGVAKMLGETHHTATGSIIGTALYMSPEQARGERPDERTDIYSLGVMLFEMITGQPPFEADSAVVILMKHVNEPVPDVREINGDAPDELVAVVEKALAKDRAHRYQTASAMAAALRAVNLRAKVAAPAAPTFAAASPTARPVQPAKKDNWLPWLVSAISVMALVLILGLGLLFVAWRFARPLILAQTVSLPAGDGMVRINGGVYLVGLDLPDDEHALPQQIQLSEFWIDQYEVMNTQYAQFLAATGRQPPASWPGGNIPAGKEAHPVEGVTWDLAAAYCEWAKKRLPTEAEWEVSARGPQGLSYPWGDSEHAVELPRGGTYAIGSIASNRSPFGVFDMAGNVWEWVGNTYAPVPDGQRVLRGGAYGFLKDMAYRLHGDPHVPTMVATAGIRCAADEVRGGTQLAETLALAPLPKGVLFQDQFSDPNSGWPAGEQDNHRFGYHPAAFYHLEVSAPNDSLTIFRELNFGDVTAEAEVLVDHTNTEGGDFRYGLAIRRSGDEYYAFTVSPRARTWRAIKRSPAGSEILAEGTNDSLRGLLAADKLRIDAAGSDFTFYINDQVVGRASDPDYSSGEVGFIVETLDESLVHIHYASLTIRDVELSQVGVLSQDQFSDPNSGWPAGEQDNHRFGYHPPDYYHLEVSMPNDSLAVSREPDLDDVSVETQVFVDHTGTESGDFRYGLAIHRSGDQYYAFTISPRARTWQVFKHSPAGSEVLAEGTNDSIRGLVAADRLRVDAKGSDYAFYINDQAVGQVSDPDYSSGEVGFIVETLDESLAHIHYDSLTIREIE